MNLDSKDLKRAYLKGTIDGYIKILKNMVMPQIYNLDLDDIEQDVKKIKLILQNLEAVAEKCLDDTKKHFDEGIICFDKKQEDCS